MVLCVNNNDNNNNNNNDNNNNNNNDDDGLYFNNILKFQMNTNKSINAIDRLLCDRILI